MVLQPYSTPENLRGRAMPVQGLELLSTVARELHISEEELLRQELRIILTDGSFVDVWFSLKLQGRYSFHWERQAIDGTIYRHDNAPHRRWEAVATFPRHFHNGSETNVSESYLSAVPEEALREFL